MTDLVGPELTDPEERLHRHLRETDLKEGRPKSTAFQVFSKDRGLLSSDRGAFGNAAAAYERFTKMGFECQSVWSVEVREGNAHNLVARADHPEDPDFREEHGQWDFRPHIQNLPPVGGKFDRDDRREIERLAKRLQEAAIARGEQFHAPTGPAPDPPLPNDVAPTFEDLPPSAPPSQ